VCSFSKEGEQEDVSLCGFAFANGEVGEEQSFASSMSVIGMFQQQSFSDTPTSRVSLTCLIHQSKILRQ
jgi:hypothetical protein